MLNKLYYCQPILGSLLNDGSEWNTLNIDYEKPHVHRVWRQVGDCRVNLQKLFPCEEHESFYHPHPWPSAIKIEKGRYKMHVGCGRGITHPVKIMSLILEAGSYYEMTDFDSWHSVQPLDEPVMSIMITGKPWNRQMPKSLNDIKLSSLVNEDSDNILEFFRKRYPNVR